MALIKCEHCGHPISDKAPFCPKCGYLRVTAVSEENLKPQGSTFPPKSNAPLKTPKGLWAMGIIGLLVLAGGIVWLVYGIHYDNELYLSGLEYQRLESLRIEERQRLEAQLLQAEQERLDSIRQDSIERAEFPDLVRKLWEGIPDHGINGLTKSSLSREFYNLVDVGFSIPTDNPGGIGEEDFLYSWYTGEEGEYDDGIVSINIISDSPELRVVKVVYKTFGQKEPHKLNFIKETLTEENGNKQHTWVIDDFDGMKNQIYNYINTTGKKFINGYANEILADPEIGGWMSASDRQEYLNQVEKFKKKFKDTYPNGILR